MADIDNALVLHDLRRESIVRELIEKTKNGGLVWNSLGGNQYQTSVIGADLVTDWDFFISKTQLGSVTYRYNLDIKKNGDTYITVTDGDLSASGRDSQTQDLYEIVEVNTLGLDARAEEVLRSIQDIVSCLEA